MDIKGYYSLLKVDPKASEREIKIAYRNLAKQYHSDGQMASNKINACKTQEEKDSLKKEMDKKFSDITAAYEVLSDSEKRKMYDRGVDTSSTGGGFGGFGGFEGGDSFFSSFFGGGERGPQKASAKVENIHITLLDVIKGIKIKKTVARKMNCKPCKSTGSLNTKTCSKCRGAGVYAEITNMGGIRFQREATCNGCMGHGILKSGPNCKDCTGKGYTVKQEELEISIPTGVVDGTKLCYDNMGDEEEDMITGDLIFIINVKEDKKFTRISREHLYTEVKVSIEDVLKQKPLRLTGIDGKQLIIGYSDIHLCDIGEDFLRIDKEGVPGLRGSNRGSLFIRIVPVLVPLNKLKELGASLTSYTKDNSDKPTHTASIIAKHDISKWYNEQESTRSSRGRSSSESSQTCQTA